MRRIYHIAYSCFHIEHIAREAAYVNYVNTPIVNYVVKNTPNVRFPNPKSLNKTYFCTDNHFFVVSGN